MSGEARVGVSEDKSGERRLLLLQLYDLNDLEVVWERGSDIMAVIAWSSCYSRILISFRGTVSARNAILDLQAYQVRGEAGGGLQAYQVRREAGGQGGAQGGGRGGATRLQPGTVPPLSLSPPCIPVSCPQVPYHHWMAHHASLSLVPRYRTTTGWLMPAVEECRAAAVSAVA